jgi:hypothetical protein
MKSIFAVLILVLAVLLSLGMNTAQAQTSGAPNNVAQYNSWNIPVRGYADSTFVKSYSGRVDTLFFRYWINRTTGTYQAPVFIRVGGAERASITLDVADTCSIGIVAKARTRSVGYGAASAWATLLTDSIRNIGATASSGLVKEFSITDTDSDLFDAVDTELMIICTTNADIHGSSGNEYRRVRLNWK